MTEHILQKFEEMGCKRVTYGTREERSDHYIHNYKGKCFIYYPAGSYGGKSAIKRTRRDADNFDEAGFSLTDAFAVYHDEPGRQDQKLYGPGAFEALLEELLYYELSQNPT